MPATNKTNNFQLPLYIASDHFSVLGDLNGAMNKIDENLGSALTQARTASRDATSALTAANDAADNTHVAKESAQSALAVASNAKGESSRALEKATSAANVADTTAAAAREASTNAANALAQATDATGKANAAAQQANGASASASSALETVQSLSSQINEAKAAGDSAKTVRTRYKKLKSGTGERSVRGSQEQNTVVFSGSIHLDPNDVIQCHAQIHHNSRAVHDLHWGIKCQGPSGVAEYRFNAAVPGAFNGAYIYSTVDGFFHADEGGGDYVFSLCFLGPNDKDTRVFLDNTFLELH